MFRLTLEMTNDCNMGCKYCYSINKKEYITKEVIEKAFEVAIKEVEKLNENELYVNFLGGEPLLSYGMIRETTKLFNKLGGEKNIRIYYGITTNLILLNEDNLQFFIDNRFSIRTSLDGDKESHDKNRIMLNKKSSYDSWIEKIPLLKQNQKKMGQEVQISMVISPNNINMIYENFHHIVNLGFTRIYTALETYSEWTEAQLEIVKSEYKKIIDYIYMQAKRRRMIYWNFLQSIQRIYGKKYKHFFCYTGKLGMYVKTNGKIYACSVCQKSGMEIGNVYQGFNSNRDNFICYNRKLATKCKKCEYLNKCVGVDCIAIKYEINNNFYDVPLFVCYTTKMRHELNIYVKELIQKDRDFYGANKI